MKNLFKICLIIGVISTISIEKSYGMVAPVDDVFPGQDLGTLACPSTTNQTGSTTGAAQDCGNSTAGDHIYQFTIPVDADVVLSLCNAGTNYDSQIWLYNLSNGNCNGGSIANNDDGGGACSLSSLISQTQLAAGTYVIVIEGYSSNTGNYELTIDLSNCAISPDDPCSAKPITVGCSGGRENGDNTGMTNSGVTAPTCGSYTGGDIWYSLVVPASGIIQLDSYEGTLTDAAMAVYSTSGGCGGTLTEIACNDDSGFGNMPKITLTGQTPGNTLYIRVWDKNNDQTGTFQIDAADLSSNYCLSNNAVDLGSGCAQLTAAANNQLGSIWDADDKLDFTASWTYDFTVNLGSSDGGADGICFVIQNDPAGLGATGASGGSMGSGGISNSIIVEIDTYLNTEDRNDGITTVLCAGGPDPDHLDIWLNGDVNPGSSTGCPGPAGTRYIANGVRLTNPGSYNIENGLDHTLRISYASGSQTLTAIVLNAAATVTYGTVSYSPINPMTLFGTNAPYFGFTASTGGLNNLQTACLAPSLVLPISLVNFDLSCDNDKVQLNWSTASEVNNDYFTIERSIDGINFEAITTIDGAGNSGNNLNYSWIDQAPINATAYYRLKQTDFNGEYSYSELLATECNSDNDINIYPNPFNNYVDLVFEQPSKSDYKIEVKNYLGQTVLNKSVPKESTRIRLELDSRLSKGAYFLQLFNDSEIKFTKKIMKL